MKAFIFDFDGVIINSENLWRKRERNFLPDLIGKDVFKKIEREILGSTIYTIYDMAKKNGTTTTEEEFYKKYYKVQSKIYNDSPLTKDIEALIEFLTLNNIKIGLVSATEGVEIKKVLDRLPQKNSFDIIISLGDRKDIQPKPFPDGYIEAMRKLKVKPLETVILEDSNKGIAAAKASGAITLCLTENLLPNYKPQGADYYMKNIQEVIQFLNL